MFELFGKLQSTLTKHIIPALVSQPTKAEEEGSLFTTQVAGGSHVPKASRLFCKPFWSESVIKHLTDTKISEATQKQ